jgi:serine kinase of HPr protein (carbohydrate metabolism regulator)
VSDALHASAVVLGERAVVLRGPAGSGKSRLALALIERARGFAALVADDRVWWEVHHGRLVVRGAPATAGVCERRGLGLVSVAYEREAVVGLLVDLLELGATPPRMPEPEDLYDEIGGVRLPRLRIDATSSPETAAAGVLAARERIVENLWRKTVNDDEVFA